MAHEFIVLFLVDDAELEQSILAAIADPDLNLPQAWGTALPEETKRVKIAAIARDIQLNAYEDGAMHGHFKVTGYRQNIDADSWMRQHFPIDPAQKVREALALMEAGTYTSSYEGKIIDKLKEALEGMK